MKSPNTTYKLNMSYLFKLESSSFEAASLSKNHTNFPIAGWTILTGIKGPSGPTSSIAKCTDSALLSPVTTTATLDAELMTGKVNVILSGGELGKEVVSV